VHRLGNVLDALLANIIESVGEPVTDMVPDRSRNANPAGLRQRLQPRGNVDAVAVDVAAIGDDVAEIDPDAEGDAVASGTSALRSTIARWISTAQRPHRRRSEIRPACRRRWS
jgi:hypothetical protein